MACGARRGALPARIGKLIAALDVPAPPQLAGVPPMMFAPPAQASPGGIAGAFEGLLGEDGYPSARVAAIAVIALLGFGTLLGSVIGGPGGPSPFYVLPNSTPVAQTEPEPATTPAAADPEVVPEAAPEATTPATTPTAATGAQTAKIDNVWLIVLSGQSYDKSFGDSESAAYLVNSLASQGAVVENYSAVARGQLANTIALTSGQAGTAQIAANCPVYNDITPATIDAANFNQVQGDGCVYPDAVHNIGDALTGAGKTWSVYAEDADNTAGGRASACAVPQTGAADPHFTSSAVDPLTTWSNPFLYFKTVTASPNCPYEVYGMSSLKSDLAGGKAPAFSMIIPNRCHDGSDAPCAPGAPAGLADSDDFLQTVVGQITATDEYKAGGLIAITFDGEPAPARTVDPTGPTGESDPTASTGATGQVLARQAGGQQVGLLLLSPFVRSGSVETEGSYDHYSLLLSIENWFSTEKLGYTADSTVKALPDELLGIEKADSAKK
ncbi:MAG: alkaline phosphatase family protein [Solirubrobacterales bacterium]